MLNILIYVVCAALIAFFIWYGTRHKGSGNSTTTKSMLTPEQIEKQQKDGSASTIQKG
jgi:hypothetical protein